jgi:hypothetical protein
MAASGSKVVAVGLLLGMVLGPPGCGQSRQTEAVSSDLPPCGPGPILSSAVRSKSSLTA